jgi:tetratricopeptide (TPR) repeat protein
MYMKFPSPALTFAFCGVLLSTSALAQDRSAYEQLDASVYQAGHAEASQLCANALPALTGVIQRVSNTLSHSDEKLISAETFSATIMERCGRNRDAEGLLRRVILGLQGLPPGPLISGARESLALLLESEGRNSEATDEAAAALSILEQTLPDDNESVIFARDVLAGSYQSTGNVVGAVQMRVANLRAMEKITPENARARKFSELMALGESYRSLGDERRSEDAFSRADEISSNPTEKSDLQNARLGRDMRRLLAAGQISSAIEIQLRLMKTAREVRASMLMSSSADEAKAVNQLAALYYLQGDYPKAAESFQESFRLFYDSWTRDFSRWTEQERLEFGDALVPSLANFYSFCYEHRQDHPELLMEMYNLVLWQKNMITRSMEQQRLAIRAGRDASLKEIDQGATRLRAEIAERTRRSASDPMLPQLRSALDADERNLASLLSVQGAAAKPAKPTISDLLHVLDSRDAAVEIIRFPLSDRYGPVNRMVYGALVARKDTHPEVSFLLLGDATAIEAFHVWDTAAMNVRGVVRNTTVQTPGSSFWLALEPAVKKTGHIYLSPDGILNQTAFFALKTSDGRDLIDTEFDIRPVSSTADLLAQFTALTDKTALLFGNPDFDHTDPGASVRASQPLTPAATIAAQAMWGNLSAGAENLDSTKREVEGIYDDLRREGWKAPPPYEQDRATKSALLSVQHPTVLHLATHGFFLERGRPGVSGMTLSENLMSGSGLLFAGANHTLRGEPPVQPNDDGVVSATEVLGLDLAGTELVVLSACSTGRGQQVSGGEIFGLRRAFQIAGTRGILMSLWEVSDGETANLMRSFYSEWLRTGDKFLALKLAAIRERRLHPDPYYWAGFVLYSRQ